MCEGLVVVVMSLPIVVRLFEFLCKLDCSRTNPRPGCRSLLAFRLFTTLYKQQLHIHFISVLINNLIIPFTGHIPIQHKFGTLVLTKHQHHINILLIIDLKLIKISHNIITYKFQTRISDKCVFIILLLLKSKW